VGEPGRARAGAAAALLLALAVAAWLWPLGVGGRMPVGGDATRFSVGLMAEYDRALAQGRLPLWNARWGYGFPGLAESQMGVYYPPHAVLYGCLRTEAAYAASLALHTFWGAAGVFWAARRFGLSPWAGALAALSWSGSGFFAIHLAHPWAVTVASWMPWAWGLAWGVATGPPPGRFRDMVHLGLVLALQVLPGHFQLAFITQVGVGLLVLAGATGRPKERAERLVLLGVAGVFGFVLAAAQLLPTFALARLAQSDRDFGYLSGFAAPPPLLVSYVAPGLFHASPLWRPIVWDPLHASPEEHLGYIGIVPLLLAFGAVWRRGRSDRATRALALVALASVLLSFGPYLPGFRLLIGLPGFSFFRAPARWGVATGLALSLLAGSGFDLIRAGAWRRPSGSLVRGAIASGLVAMAAVVAVEAVARAATAPAASGLAAALRTALNARPWPTAPDEVRRMREGMTGPSREALVVEGLLRRGEDPARARWDRDRAAIYREELAPAAIVLFGVLVVAAIGRKRPGFLLPALVVLTAADVVGNGHLRRLVESGPIAPLESQSPVLAAMAALPDGSRVLAGLGNLPMVAGVAPLESYRTLDRPIMPVLTAMARGAEPGRGGLGADAARAVGVRLIVRPGSIVDDGYPRLRDDALTRWSYGERGAARLGPPEASYGVWEPTASPVRAWFLPGAARISGGAQGVSYDPGLILEALAGGARPAEFASDIPERMTVTAQVEAPGMLLLTVLGDPEWAAEMSRDGGPMRAIPIERAFANARGDGWMAVRLHEPGRWTVRLRYRGQMAAMGRKLSVVFGGIWLVSYGLSRLGEILLRRAQARRGEGAAQ
jgi:hypothetical protein